GSRREFARRFAEGIGKLAGNMKGDHWEKTRGLTTRMLEATGLMEAARRRGSQPPCRAGHSRPPARGRSTTARASPQGRSASLAGPTSRKGGRCRSQGQQPAGAATRRGGGHTSLQRDARKGGRLQGARKGLLHVASPAASRGSGAGRRGCRPLAGWLPAGKGSRCLCRGNSGDDKDGARGVRASF
ncbi:hypothetical protein BHE74_00058039, partial [Ensete ventricosum]